MNVLSHNSFIPNNPMSMITAATAQGAVSVSDSKVNSLLASEEPYYETLNTHQLDALDRILDQTHILTVRPFTLKEMENFTPEQKKLANQSFPEIELTLKQFYKEIRAKLLEVQIRAENFLIVGSASANILCGTSCKDTDGNFYISANTDFRDLKQCIVAYLKDKIPSSLRPPIPIDEFVLRYLTDAKLVKDKASAIPWALYGLGPNLDVKFSHQSKLRHTITPADGFCVNPETKKAHCVHLGKITTKKNFLRGIEEATYRCCSIDMPQKVSRLIYRLASLLTKAFDLNHFVFPIALQQLKTDYPLKDAKGKEALIKAFYSYRERAYKTYNEVGKALNFLNFLSLLTCCYEKAGIEENKITFQYVNALAASWIMENPLRKNLQNCVKLLLKYPEDGLNILQVIQGMLLQRWLNGDPFINAYDLDYARNVNTPKMHFRIQHAFGDQHLSLPHSPDEMALRFLRSYQYLYEKYEKSEDLNLLKSLSQDIEINNQVHAVLPTPKELIDALIEKFDCQRVETILRERFQSKKVSVFYETLEKSLNDTSHALQLSKKIFLCNLTRYQQEANETRQKDLSSLFTALKQAVQPHSSSGQDLEKLLFLFKQELTKKSHLGHVSQFLIQALVHICQQVSLLQNSTSIQLRQRLLMIAVELGLKDAEVISKCTDILHRSAQPFINKDHSEFVLRTMEFLVVAAKWNVTNAFEIQHKEMLVRLSTLMQPIVEQWMKSSEIEDKREVDIYFCLMQFIKVSDEQSIISIKKEVFKFAAMTMVKYQVTSFKMSVNLILEINKRNVVLDKEEQVFCQQVYLKGLCSVFAITHDTDDVKANDALKVRVDQAEMYHFFISIFNKFFPPTKSFEPLSKFDKQTVRANISLVLKSVLEFLSQDHLLTALELFHLNERSPLLPRVETEMRHELNQKLVASPNRENYINVFYSWRHAMSAEDFSKKDLREKHFTIATDLLQRFSKESSTRVQGYIIFIISNLHQLINLYKEKTPTIVKLIKITFNLSKTNKVMEIQNCLEKLISLPVIQEILGREEVEDFYLTYIQNAIQKIESLSDQSEERFLFTFLKNPQIHQHPRKEEIFNAVKSLVEKYLDKESETFDKKCAAIFHLLISSSFIPERWNGIGPLYMRLLKKGENSFNQTLIDCYHILEQKNCLKTSEDNHAFFIFFQRIDRADLYKPIWKNLVKAAPAVIRKACTLLKGKSDSSLVADAFIHTNKKDPELFQQLVSLSVIDSSTQHLQLILEAIQGELRGLINDTKAFEILLQYFQAMYRIVGTPIPTLEKFWLHLENSPFLALKPKREELTRDFLKIQKPCFLFQVYVWINDPSISLKSFKTDFFNTLIKLPYHMIKDILSRISSKEKKKYLQEDLLFKLLSKENALQIKTAADLLMDMEVIDFLILMECMRVISYYEKKSLNLFKNAFVLALNRSVIAPEAITPDLFKSLKNLLKRFSQEHLELSLELTKSFLIQSSKPYINKEKKIEIREELQKDYFDLLFYQNILLANDIKFKKIDEPQIDLQKLKELQNVATENFSPQLFEKYKEYIDKELLKQMCSWSTGQKKICYETAQSFMILASVYIPFRARAGLNSLFHKLDPSEPYKYVLLSNLLNIYDQNKVHQPTEAPTLNLQVLQKERWYFDIALISTFFQSSQFTSDPKWVSGWNRLEKLQKPTVENPDCAYWVMVIFAYEQLFFENVWGLRNNSYARCKEFFKELITLQIKIPETAVSKKPAAKFSYFIHFFERQVIFNLIPAMFEQYKESMERELAGSKKTEHQKVKQKHEAEFHKKLADLLSKAASSVTLQELLRIIPILEKKGKDFSELKTFGLLRGWLDLILLEHFHLFSYREVGPEILKLLNTIKVIYDSDFAKKYPNEMLELFGQGLQNYLDEKSFAVHNPFQEVAKESPSLSVTAVSSNPFTLSFPTVDFSAEGKGDKKIESAVAESIPTFDRDFKCDIVPSEDTATSSVDLSKFSFDLEDSTTNQSANKVNFGSFSDNTNLDFSAGTGNKVESAAAGNISTFDWDFKSDISTFNSLSAVSPPIDLSNFSFDLEDKPPANQSAKNEIFNSFSDNKTNSAPSNSGSSRHLKDETLSDLEFNEVLDEVCNADYELFFETDTWETITISSENPEGISSTNTTEAPVEAIAKPLAIQAQAFERFSSIIEDDAIKGCSFSPSTWEITPEK